MNWRKITGGFLLMLAGGFITIGTEHLMLLHHRQLHHRAPTAAATPAILSTLDDVLDLSAAQRDSIEKIMARHQTAIDSAWRAIHRELGSSMDSVHREMGRILTPEQDRKFKAWLRSQH